jgi:hypothetical protein
MVIAPEPPKTSTGQFVPVAETPIRGQSNADDSPSVICDLAEGSAFVESYGKPHIPVMSAFGAGALHAYRCQGFWNLDRALAENAHFLFRSIRNLDSTGPDQPAARWDDLTFRFGPKSFLYMDKLRLIGFARTPAEAERLVTRFAKTYASSAPHSKGEFYLIQTEGTGIKAHKVTLPPASVLSPEALSLHYGPGIDACHDSFLAKLRAHSRGLTIFEGLPGTGKTFYIRNLMAALEQSHRFYFVPTAALDALSRPDFIGFWIDQLSSHAARQFVVVLEDADAALMTRGADNREQVSAILNLSDGLLGDFLRLHIICTINCSSADIDPALLRPGRLLCHRVFRRLDYAQAARLAESLGRKLPVAGDYSLAEVFAGNETHEIQRPRIGFAN